MKRKKAKKTKVDSLLDQLKREQAAMGIMRDRLQQIASDAEDEIVDIEDAESAIEDVISILSRRH